MWLATDSAATGAVSLRAFIIGLIGAALAWLFTEFIGRPFRQFFDMRRQVGSNLVVFANVMARAKWDGDQRKPLDIPKSEDERLTEAQETFRCLGGEMRAFANGEFFANWIVKLFGFNTSEISKALIAYSNEISTYGEPRNLYHGRIEKLLRIRSTE